MTLRLRIIIILLLGNLFFLNGQNKDVSIENFRKKQFDSLKKSFAQGYMKSPQEHKKTAFLLNKYASTTPEKITAYKALGYVYSLTSNRDSTMFYLSNRLKLTKRYYPDSKEYNDALLDYVNCCGSFIDTTVITELLTSAMAKTDIKTNKEQFSLMCLFLGQIFFRDKDYKKAEYYYNRFFKLSEKKLPLEDFYRLKIDLYLAQNDLKQAKKYLENSTKLGEKITKVSLSSNLIQLGNVNYKLKNFKVAKENFLQSLKIQNQNKYKDLKSQTYLGLALLEKIDRNAIREKKYLDSAKTFYDDNLYTLREINKAYADFYSREYDFDNEILYTDLYTKVVDSINTTETIQTKLKLESIYQLKENKKQLALQNNILYKETKLKRLYLISAFLLLLFTVVIFWIFNKKYKTQKKLNENQFSLHEQTLKLMQENQRTEIIKEKIKAKMEERGKLSLELHDGIANEIASLKISISSEKELDQAKIESVINKVDKLYNEVRNLSHDLDPDNIADVEFSQLVNNLCLITEKNGLKTEKNIIISKNVDELDENVLLNMYRILQEAINNTIKHAFATEVKIDVIESEAELYLAVKDNGKGFSNTTLKSGIGIKNIQKRVNLLKGICNISNSSLGTTVAIRIPKNQLQMKVA
ncbi:MAG: histidine kinase [Limnohabitans sp.]|nr:histidine kinase [Limnohabitans sp.]